MRDWPPANEDAVIPTTGAVEFDDALEASLKAVGFNGTSECRARKLVLLEFLRLGNVKVLMLLRLLVEDADETEEDEETPRSESSVLL